MYNKHIAQIFLAFFVWNFVYL